MPQQRHAKIFLCSFTHLCNHQEEHPLRTDFQEETQQRNPAVSGRKRGDSSNSIPTFLPCRVFRNECCFLCCQHSMGRYLHNGLPTVEEPYRNIGCGQHGEYRRPCDGGKTTWIVTKSQQVPLFIMAARNNPLIKWLNLSFDTFNLLHRWFGRIVVLEALAHAISWAASTVSTGGWSAVQKAITTNPMEMYGFIVSINHRRTYSCNAKTR